MAAQNGGDWTGHASVGFVKAVEVLELMRAGGLILPAVLDIAAVMVPVTNVCWVLLMAGAVITVITDGSLGQFSSSC